MTKYYHVEVKLTTRWSLMKSFTRYKEAIQFVKDNLGERYLMRIVKVTREVVLGDKNG